MNNFSPSLLELESEILLQSEIDSLKRAKATLIANMTAVSKILNIYIPCDKGSDIECIKNMNTHIRQIQKRLRELKKREDKTA